VDALARRKSATPYMAMLATFAVLLYRYGGRGDVVIGAPVANRTHPDAQKLIGSFVNLLSLRLRLGGGTTFRALLRDARARAGGAGPRGASLPNGWCGSWGGARAWAATAPGWCFPACRWTALSSGSGAPSSTWS
jgi:hypothetical protein